MNRNERDFREVLVSKFARDQYNNIIGGLENQFADEGKIDEQITVESLADSIIADLMTSKRNIRLECGICLEPKHIRFLGKEKVSQIVRDRVNKLYQKDGCWAWEA